MCSEAKALSFLQTTRSQEENPHPRVPALLAWAVPQLLPRMGTRGSWWPLAWAPPHLVSASSGDEVAWGLHPQKNF